MKSFFSRRRKAQKDKKDDAVSETTKQSAEETAEAQSNEENAQVPTPLPQSEDIAGQPQQQIEAVARRASSASPGSPVLVNALPPPPGSPPKTPPLASPNVSPPPAQPLSPRLSATGSMFAKAAPQLPPGVKLMKGPAPPPGVMFIKGAPPPGAMLMKGPPPPGAMLMKGPPHMGDFKKMMGPVPPGAVLMASPHVTPGGTPAVSPMAPPALKMPTHTGLQSPSSKSPSPPLSPRVKQMGKMPPPHPQGKTPLPPSPSLAKQLPSPTKAPPPHPQQQQQQQYPPQQQQQQQQRRASAPSPSPPKEIPIPPRFDGTKLPASRKQSVSLPAPEVIKKPLAPRDLDSDSDDVQFVLEDEAEPEISQKDSPTPRVVQRKDQSRSPSRNSSILFQAADDSKPASMTSSKTFRVEDDDTVPPHRHHGSNNGSFNAIHSRQTTSLPLASASTIVPVKKAHVHQSGGQKKGEKKPHQSSSTALCQTDKAIDTPNAPVLQIEDDGDSDSGSDGSPQDVIVTAKKFSRGDTSGSRKHATSSEVHDGFIQPIESKSRLPPAVRSRIADQFLSILCPQQFYGKVKKLHHIRLVSSDRESVTGLKQHSSIFVATKGKLPNQFFFPQLRLNESDGIPCTGNGEEGCVDTHIVLYEAAPGNMLFAETELEARRLVENHSSANSCFVLEKSAILFKDALKHVLPVAMLTVQWIPYSSAQSEPQCPVHHRELQLFDRYTKELMCALCVSKSGANMSDLIIIPDVLTGDSRRRIMETLSQHLEQGQQNAAQWVGQHQRVVSIAQHKKEAVQKQFDLLVAAINCKRDEYLEACDASYGFALSHVAKEILTADEKVRLLRAAIDHLRTETTKPLYSMQVATVASALNSSDEFPQSFSPESLKIPILTNELTPNLEGVMSEVQRVAPMNVPSVTSRARTTHSPYHTNPKDDPEEAAEAADTQRYASARDAAHPTPPPHPSWAAADGFPPRRRRLWWRESVSPPVRRSAPRGHSAPPLLRRDGAARGQWVALPGCRGTCVWDAPIHKLLGRGDGARLSSTRPRAVQWALRIDDPGDWVGVGVGVGGTVESWAASRMPDLSHVWVIPSGDTRRAYVLRVSVNPSVGHAKLTIHDKRGRQLDDGRIPQWNAARSCYPQVTFGGRIGEVQLTDGPRLVEK